MATPYDGKVWAWFVYGGMVGERTIAELAQTVKQYAPGVSGIFVKVTGGRDGMGAFDSPTNTKPDLAINGPNDINRWVSTLAKYNLEFHAWALPKGVDPNAEGTLLMQVCQQPGVRSMILDVEGCTGFFRGGRAGGAPLVTGCGRGGTGAYHVGSSMEAHPARCAD